jgi:2-methylaconitate cis-trans-isomerase PrpF
MKSDLFSTPQDRHNQMIDGALRAISNATPREGLEGRVAIRIAHARNEKLQPIHRGVSWARLVVTATSCAVACAIIIAGSVHHSRATLPASPNGDIRLMGPSGGLGAASAAHLATQEVTPTGRPRAVRKTTDGRATIAPDAQKRAGEAVPQQP